jgi:sugar phosphate isomerase/epimerase
VTIAAQAYTLRSVMGDDVPATLHRLREVGYENVELAGLHGLTAARMRSCLAEAGIRAISAHEPWARVAADGGEAMVADMHELGIADVVVPSMPADRRDSGPDGYRRFGRALAERAAALADRSLRLHYHNHRFELETRHGESTGLDTLIEASGPGVGLELDLAWVRGAGDDPARWVARVPADRIRLVHVKDVALGDGGAVDTEVGRGVIEWPPVIAACRDAGVWAYIVEQDTPGPDPFESLAVSLAAVRRLLDGEG